MHNEWATTADTTSEEGGLRLENPVERAGFEQAMPLLLRKSYPRGMNLQMMLW